MRVYNLILGFLIVIIFTSGILEIGLNGFLEKNISDIKNNLPLSIAILIFVSYSLIAEFFFRDSLVYFSGIITGLGVATFLTGFDYALGFVVILYSTQIKIHCEKHNKFKNESAASGSDASSTRPF